MVFFFKKDKKKLKIKKKQSHGQGYYLKLFNLYLKNDKSMFQSNNKVKKLKNLGLESLKKIKKKIKMKFLVKLKKKIKKQEKSKIGDIWT